MTRDDNNNNNNNNNNNDVIIIIIIIIIIMFVGNLSVMPEAVRGVVVAIPVGTKGCFVPILLLGRVTWLLIHIRFLPVEA